MGLFYTVSRNKSQKYIWPTRTVVLAASFTLKRLLSLRLKTVNLTLPHFYCNDFCKSAYNTKIHEQNKHLRCDPRGSSNPPPSSTPTQQALGQRFRVKIPRSRSFSTKWNDQENEVSFTYLWDDTRRKSKHRRKIPTSKNTDSNHCSDEAVRKK